MFNRRELEDLRRRVEALEKSQQDVRSEGEKYFSEKRVQTIVYGFIAMILTAAGTAFIGGVPWL